MKDLSIYFQAIEENSEFPKGALGKEIQIHTNNSFPEVKKSGTALIEVPEYRKNTDKQDKNFKGDFRTALYQLYAGYKWNHSIYDLGTIQPGETYKDTLHAIETVCEELIKNNVVPIIIGGSQDLTIGMYKAYEQLEQFVNISTVDNQLDLGSIDEDVQHNAWLSHVLLHKPCYLFNYSNLGAQAHYLSTHSLDLFNEMYFDVCRLGEINNNIVKTEPLMRNTDLLSIDLTSVRASDLQNMEYTAPNGLFSHELCQISKYAGISDKLSSIGIFNYYSNRNACTDEFVAQLIWYFNDGYANRKGDFPVGSKKSYTKYTVHLEEVNENIIFYKSDKSERWWIEVPYPGSTHSKFTRHQLVPCTYSTYQKTMEGEVPNLWWKTYQRLS